MRPRTLLLACGVLSSLAYVASNVVGSLRWPEYSSAAQTISELYAIDAPSRATVYPIGIAYDVLLFAFGVGVWMRAAGRRGLGVAALLLMLIGALGPIWPPMHLRGTEPTLTDTLHIVFAAVVSASILAAIAVSARTFGRAFRIYSIATIAILLVFGAVTSTAAPNIPTNLPTPWIGITERINLAAFLVWVAVLAVALLREHEGDGAPVGTAGISSTTAAGGARAESSRRSGTSSSATSCRYGAQAAPHAQATRRSRVAMRRRSRSAGYNRADVRRGSARA